MSANASTVGPIDHEDVMLQQEDAEIVLEQFASGRPLDPSVAERVRAQAALILEQIRRSRGLVDEETFQSLLDEET